MERKNAGAVDDYALEADRDYVVANRETLVEEYYGLVVVVHNQKVEGAYASVAEACTEGAKRFGDGAFSVHNMLDYRCEEDKKWDDTLDTMTEEDAARLEQWLLSMATGDVGPLEFPDE
jgi:hypothetical protein